MNSEVNTMKTRGRISGVELYRALLMFGICLLHVFSIGGNKVGAWGTGFLRACVCGFVFISGYYGIKFRWKKLFILYGLAAYASVISTIAFHLYALDECGNLFERFAVTFRNFWFLNAYAVLMLMSPILNLLLKEDGKDARTALVLCVICTVGWSFVAQLPFFRSYLPQGPGLHNYSGFMFMGIYVISGLWRKYEEVVKQNALIRMLVWGVF